MSEEEIRSSLEEVTEEVGDAVEDTAEVVEEPVVELSDIEREAMAQGWKPASEFSDADKSFVSAKEFVERGKFYKKIAEQGKELKELRAVISDVNSHMKRSEEAAYKRAMEELQGQRREAVESGDLETYDRVTQQQNEMMKNYASATTQKTEAPAAVDNIALREFQDRNKWFNLQSGDKTEVAMSSYAVMVDNKLINEHPHMPETERLLLVEKEVKEMYPQKFGNVHQSRPSPVEAPKRVAKKKGIQFSDLPEDYRAVGMRLVKRIPGFTKERYVEDLIKQGVIRDDS